MKVFLVVLALCGLSAAAPQNWPYRDSLMPYRYGYPSQTQYKYLPQIEDDEDVGPYPGLGRQDVAVGNDADRVRPTPDSVAPGVVETGSVAPVVEATKAPIVVQPVQPTRAPQQAPPPRPIGPDGGNRPVQPPVFPPARPPPTPPPRESETEEEEDDESDEEEADDEAPVQEEGDDDGPPGDEDDDQEEEEEEERRRQEPLNSDETVEVAQVTPVVADKVKPTVPVPAPAPVVVAPVKANKTVVVSESSVEDVVPTQVVESNEVSKPDSDDESSEEQGLGDGVEALVPGYVTDQGEILVPVDTVSGDQPISIVPDPYSPPARGIPVRGSQSFRTPYDDGYSNHYYYSDDIYEGLGRQGLYYNY